MGVEFVYLWVVAGDRQKTCFLEFVIPLRRRIMPWHGAPATHGTCVVHVIAGYSYRILFPRRSRFEAPWKQYVGHGCP
jgi:hypothetical protein